MQLESINEYSALIIACSFCGTLSTQKATLDYIKIVMMNKKDCQIAGNKKERHACSEGI